MNSSNVQLFLMEHEEVKCKKHISKFFKFVIVMFILLLAVVPYVALRMDAGYKFALIGIGVGFVVILIQLLAYLRLDDRYVLKDIKTGKYSYKVEKCERSIEGDDFWYVTTDRGEIYEMVEECHIGDDILVVNYDCIELPRYYTFK